MAISRSLPAVAAAVVLASAVVPVVAPAASAAAEVAQGAALRVDGRYTCTIGYNDAKQGLSYTAGHCGKAGARVSTPDGSATGTFSPSLLFGSSDTGNDWGLVTWDPGVRLGPNRFSGDAVVDPADVSKGDRVCFYGSASGRMHCGAYVGSLANNVYFDAGDGDKGDSGGPVWVQNRGFIGVFSGASKIWDDGGLEVSLSRASQPINGDAVRGEQEIELLSAYGRVHTPKAHAAYVPGEGAAGAAAKLTQRAQQRSSESSSSAIVGSSENAALPGIVAIVVGVAVASIPVLLKMAEELAPLYLPTSAP